jgi:hypothetical protein
LTIDDLTATTVAGLDTSSGTGNEQIFTDGEGGLTARGYVNVSQLPVAYQNLVAWYPFDLATYSGSSNANDVTATLGGSGDDTAYDGTVNGAAYQSSGGVTDINAGANSGAFDFDGVNDTIDITTVQSAHNYDNPYSATVWFNPDSTELGGIFTSLAGGKFDQRLWVSSGKLNFESLDTGITSNSTINTNRYYHAGAVKNSSGLELYVDGSLEVSTSVTGSEEDNGSDAEIGLVRNDGFFDGNIDDLRIYNRALTASEISAIYNNTEP